MGNMDYLNGDILYVIEVRIDDECLYMYTKNTALHFPDLGKKFVYRRSAVRYFKGSWFERRSCPFRIVKYSRRFKCLIDK